MTTLTADEQRAFRRAMPRFPTACVAADRLGHCPAEADVRGIAARPITQPITLRELAR